MKRRAVRGPDGDAGVSLAELAVGMGLTAIVLVGLGTVFTGTMRTVGAVNVKSSTTADLRIATESMSRSLRVALQPKGTTSAISAGTQRAMTFYTLINRSTGPTPTGISVEPLPMRVEYWHDGTCLNEARTPATAVVSPPATGPFYSWPTTSRTVVCLMRTSMPPTFSYYTSGLLTSASVPVAPITLATPTTALTAAQLTSVQSVEVSLNAKDASRPTLSGSSASFRVTLQNVVMALGGN